MCHNSVKHDQQWRTFAQARAFARALALGTRQEWMRYCQSGHKPEDMPSSPERIYREEFGGWSDWLGRQPRSFRRSGFRPFQEARAFVQTLGLTSLQEWKAYCRSGHKPADIPTNPNRTYQGEYQTLGDWLGTGRVATQQRVYLPFAQARAFVHTLGLKTGQQWRAYCASGHKPDSIPNTPEQVYRDAFQGMADWLGAGRSRPGRHFLPFQEARQLVQTLGLSTYQDWITYCTSGQRPLTIPSNPWRVYAQEFSGMADWLGKAHRWSKHELVAFLEHVRQLLPTLWEQELYAILHQGGAFPMLCSTFGGVSPVQALRQIIEQDEQEMQQTLGEPEKLAFPSDLPELAEDDLSQQECTPSLDRLLSHQQDGLPDGPPGSRLWSQTVPLTSASLHSVDQLAPWLTGAAAEVVDDLITHRVYHLWEIASHRGWEAVAPLLEGDGGPFYTAIKQRFLAEWEAVKRLEIPAGWALTDQHGLLVLPNLMQRRTAWEVKQKRRVGNWSGTGAGKTLAALLASRVIGAHMTLIVTTQAAIGGWVRQIQAAYPDSLIFTTPEEIPARSADGCSYLILNYEKFQRSRREQLVQHVLALSLDFIVFDEVQFVKRRQSQSSHRRHALEVLVEQTTIHNPNVHVLGMSATPVINTLQEGKTILELVTGTPCSAVDATRQTVSNALCLHRALMHHGFRFRPLDEQAVELRILSTARNDLWESVLAAQTSLLAIEQALLPAKLALIQEEVHAGTLVYTHYVDGLIDPICSLIQARGLSVGHYTGREKSGLSGFLTGDIEVLVGSRPVGTGLDGLQTVCARIILLCLPWTSAEFEQLIGRIRRQGSAFRTIEVIIPQVVFDHEGESWSWDQLRLAALEYKRTLSACAVDGCLPEMVRLNRQALLQQSRQALQHWIARMKQGEASKAVEREAGITEP